MSKKKKQQEKTTERILLGIPDEALKNGVHIVAGPGSGKSRMMGRLIVWENLVRGIPQVVLDPVGGVNDNLLDKLARSNYDERRWVWPRLEYIDEGASDYIVPTPLFYRVDRKESLAKIANRFASVIVKLDPDFQRAPIMGKNSFEECASYGGQIAAALGRQLDFIADLVKHPGIYKDLLTQALENHPELSEAVDYFRKLMEPNNPGARERKTGSFLNKIHPFLSDPAMKATYCAPKRGINWAEVVRKKQTVLIDFRNEWDDQQRQFKMLWWLKDFITYAKLRGTKGRKKEITLVIDEITQLLGYHTGEESPLAGDIEELTTVLGRNFGVNVIIAHQNLQQIDERIRNALMQMGTQVIGTIADPDDALYLARKFLRYEPYLVKKVETHWGVMREKDAAQLYPSSSGMWRADGKPYSSTSERAVLAPINENTVEFTPEEQILIVADLFKFQKKFEFRVRPALAEGQIGTRLILITIENLDKGEYPNARDIAVVRNWIRQRWGEPVEKLLAKIERRKRAIQAQAKSAKRKALPPSDTIGEHPTHATNNLPDTSATPATPKAKRKDVFQ